MAEASVEIQETKLEWLYGWNCPYIELPGGWFIQETERDGARVFALVLEILNFKPEVVLPIDAERIDPVPFVDQVERAISIPKLPSL